MDRYFELQQAQHQDHVRTTAARFDVITIPRGWRRQVTAEALAAVVIAFALGVPAVAVAQKNPPARPPQQERAFRGGLGLLVGSTGFGGAFDLSLNRGTRLYRFRITGHDNSIASWQNVESVSISESALMLGRGRRYGPRYGSVSAGLAVVEVTRPADDNGTTTVGVPLEAQLLSGGPVRLGATLAANLNLERSFGAFILSVQFGRVPER